ncbi:hypothetical protein M1408_03035 [Candidatus Marsarchaeota archaeon]|nr:hypothetical protein [Candidatus Marsarchaeota archaeon]
MAASKKNQSAHKEEMTFDEARLFLQLKWYVESTIEKDIDIPMFSSMVGRELDSISEGRRSSISRLHMDYLLMRHAELGQEVPRNHADAFRKDANNGHAASLASLKKKIEMSRIVDGASELSWREAGAVILHIIDSVRWEDTKKMLSTLMRSDPAPDESDEYLY